WLMAALRLSPSDRRRLSHRVGFHGGKRDGVRAHLLPLAQFEAVRRKEGADTRTVPPQHVFQHGNQHAQRVAGSYRKGGPKMGSGATPPSNADCTISSGAAETT